MEYKVAIQRRRFEVQAGARKAESEEEVRNRRPFGVSPTDVADSPDNGRKWLGEKVLTYSGTIDAVATEIPVFTRHPFSTSATRPVPRLHLSGGKPRPRRGENQYYDVIVRRPLRNREQLIPVGIVSRSYRLVQHHQLLNAARGALQSIDVDLSQVDADLEITEYGSRMLLQLRLPAQHHFDPGDGKPMTLRLACINSVEGSLPLQVWLGWLRLVCSNGMIVGAVLSHLRQVHDASLDLSDLPAMLEGGLRLAKQDRNSFENWYRVPVSEVCLIRWVDGPVQKGWGVKAAARVWHIAKTGHDGEFADPFEERKPAHEKTMKSTAAVPGAHAPAANAFAVSQILSWVASARHDVQQRIDWMRSIPELMNELVSS